MIPFSFQEFSQRYADPTQDLGFVTREARLQDEKNRQNSIQMDSDDDSRRLAYQWENHQKNIQKMCMDTYQWALEHGIAKEQARAVLPEGMMESRIYMNGTLRSWVHFIELRSSNGTQKEHQEVALECARVIAEIFPLAETLVQNWARPGAPGD